LRFFSCRMLIKKTFIISGLLALCCLTSMCQIIVASDLTSTGDGNKVYDLLGVERPSKTPRIFRRLSWRMHAKILPLLHWGDQAQPRDVDVNLRVLWSKAISSLDKNSLANEDRETWTYWLLPPKSRWLLRIIPTRLFPRWLHANIELRTVYLNQLIEEEISNTPPGKKIRLIALGGGYDARSLRLLNAADRRIHTAWELDQAGVIKSKGIMLDRICKDQKRVLSLPQLRIVDLTNLRDVENTVEEITRYDDDDQNEWHSILISEAVLMYLPNGVPSRVLSIFARVLGGKNPSSVSFCFVERFEGVADNDKTSLASFLANAGWNALVKWQPKPGRTNHMGKATTKVL
jgi:hypothetical protein